MRTLSQNMYDDFTGKAWTDEDFKNALERARNLWREVYPDLGISFRGKSVAPTPPGGPPPKGAPRDIGPIAAASGFPTKARPPPKPTRPAPSPPKAASKPATAPKAEEPASASASSVKKEPSPTAPEPAPKVAEPAPVKEEQIGMPPGLVDELQAMTPAQKKARCY